MVIMKKLMMFYSLAQTKTIHPQASRYLEGWYNLYISYDNERHVYLATELQTFFFNIYCILIPRNGSYNWELGQWTCRM